MHTQTSTIAKLIQYPTRASLYDGPFGGDVGWPAAGMGYILVTQHKHLIVIDGGHAEDAEELLSLLSQQVESASPRVSLWIVTHPHLDHYGALREIAARVDLRERITVDELVYCFPESFRDATGKATCVRANAHMGEICRSLNAKAHTPAPEGTTILDGVTLTYWFVPTDVRGLNNPNSLSLIFTLCGNRKRVMITGDACPITLRQCADGYGDKLKSDILQMPHHGLCDTGYEPFYQAVSADTLLVPISRAGDAAMHSDAYGSAPDVNHAAEASAAYIHRAYEGILSLEI